MDIQVHDLLIFRRLLVRRTSYRIPRIKDISSALLLLAPASELLKRAKVVDPPRPCSNLFFLLDFDHKSE